MSRNETLKYQLGTALVSGRPRMLLASQGRLFDVLMLLNDTRIKKALSLEDVRIPHSLLHMLDDWPYWKEQLPQIVAYLLERHKAGEPSGQFNADELRWLPPLMYPRKLICIGTNYSDHIAEMGSTTLPRYPYSFLKPPTTTLVGSGETVLLPKKARLIDWEAELAVIIGHNVRDVQGEEAMACIAGYSIINDLSARDWLAEPTLVGIDWVMQKAFDGFTPMGPFITPAEFVADPQQLHMTLTVNGAVKQDSTTANMVFSVQAIIEHLASIMTLEPGDVIATGTPAGVGYGKKPQEFLQSGDVVIVEIEGLGRLETYVK